MWPEIERRHPDAPPSVCASTLTEEEEEVAAELGQADLVR